MKKKMYFLLMALIMTISGFTQTTITIGTGSADGSYVPTNNYYDHSFTEAIYPMDSIGQTGLISQLAYYCTSNAATRHLTVYMLEDTTSSFAAASNYIPIANFTQVFDGNVSFINNGWATINLSMPFMFHNTSNLIIAVYDHTGSYNSRMHFGATAATNSCIYYYQDAYFAPTAPTGTSNTYSNRPNIQLTLSDSATYCYPASNLVSSSLTATGATLTWNTAIGATSYDIEYKLQSDTSWANATTVTSTDTTIALANLLSNTMYEARVQNDCGSTQSGYTNIVSFTTLNGASNATLPYTCDFEDSIENAAWTFVQLGETNKWYIGSDTANSVNNTTNGAKGLYVSNDNGQTYAYSLAPSYSQNAICYAYRDIDVPAGATQLALSFDWKAMGYNATGDFLRFFVVDADSTTITAGQILSNGLDVSAQIGNPTNGSHWLSQHNTWQHKDFIITNTQYPFMSTSNKIRLLIQWRVVSDWSLSQPPAAVDNISIYQLTCPQPMNVATSSLDTTNATIHWTETGTSTNYTLQYDTVSTFATADSVTVTDTTATLTNLIPNTVYYYRVKSVCGAGDESFWTSGSFRTACSDMVIPYTETFDSYSSGSYMSCWSRLNTYPYGTYPQVSSSHARSGNALSFYASSGYNTAIAPMIIDTITNPMSSLSVSFYYSTTSSYYSPKVTIGVMTDPTADSTFVPLDTITCTTTWQHFELSLASYTGNGQYIAIRTSGNAYGPSYVDDFSIFTTPTCPATYGLVQTNMTNSNITVSWDTTNSAHQGWNVSYAVYDSTTTFDPASGTIVNTTDNPPYTITGLTAGTTYQIAVQQACTAGSGNWSNIITVNTMGLPAQIPYTCNFEDQTERSSWYLSNSTCTNKWFIGNAVTANGTTDTISGYSLYVSNDNGVTNAYSTGNSSTVIATRQLTSTGAGGYTLEFDARVNGESSYDYIKVFVDSTLLQGAASTASYSTTSYTGNGALKLGTTQYYYNYSVAGLTTTTAATAVRHLTVTLPYEGESGHIFNLMFMWRNDGSDGNQPPAAIDNINVTEITCAAPSNVTASNIDTASAVISWTAASSATAWRLYYRLASATTYDSIDVTTNPYTLTGLTPNSAYNVYVETDCNGSMSLPSSVFSFRTACTPVTTLPFSENFDTYSYGAFMPCWSRVTYSDYWDTYPMTYPYESHSGSSSLYLSGSSTNPTYAVTPMINVDIHTLHVTFYEHHSEGVFDVGVMSDPTDTSTFELVQTIATASSFTFNDVSFNSTTLEGDTLYVAFRFSPTDEYQSSFIDDIIINTIPACGRPTGVAVSNITMTTADVAWTAANATDNSWRIFYQASGDTAWDSVDVTTNPYTLTGLTSATAYSIYVTTNCGDGSISNPSLPTLSFHTTCSDLAVNSFPWTEGFENGVFCWNQTNVSGSSSWAINGADPGHYTAPEGSNFAGIYSTGDEVTRLESPVLDISSLTTPYLIFKHVQSAWGSDQDTLGVYYRTDTSSAWTYLTSFSNNIESWQTDSVALPSGSATYQIGFLGYVTYGHGIGLDSVVVYDQNGGSPVLTQPTVATLGATSVAQTTATLNGTITDGTNPVTARGFEYKQTVAGAYLAPVTATGTSSITYNATGLLANTQYTYRAYATTAAGTVYGDTITFTTLADTTPSTVTPPTVVTVAASGIAATSAVLNGTVTAGTHAITAQGFQWKATNGGTYATVNGTISGTTLSATITNLTAATEYTYRAFATTADTTVYGVEMTFTTSAAVVTPPTVVTVAASGIAATSAVLNGTVTAGTHAITAQGFQWKATNGGTYATIAGTISGTTLSATITNLTAATEYTYRAFATTADTTVYGVEKTFTTLNSIADVNGNEFSVKLYPNPTEGDATLSVEGLNEEATVIMTDVQGRVISSEKIAAGQKTFTIRRNNISSGVYYIRVITNEAIKTEKLIVK